MTAEDQRGKLMDEQGGYTPRQQDPDQPGERDPYARPRDPSARDPFAREPFARPQDQADAPAQPNTYGQPGGYGQPSSPAPAGGYGQPAAYGQPGSYWQPEGAQTPSRPDPYAPPQAPPEYAPTAQYGQPGAPAYMRAPQRKQGFNGFAIAGFVLSLICVLLLSVIFSLVALSQIKKNGQRGRGLAITALVLSAVWVLAIGGFVAYALTTTADRSSDGTVTSAGSIGVQDLKVGDCLKSFGEGTVTSLDVVPCAQPHGAQAVLEFSFSGTKFPKGYPYPGDAKVSGAAEKGCVKRAPASLPDDDSVGLAYLYPVKELWDSGDRTVTCLVTTGDGGQLLTKSYSA